MALEGHFRHRNGPSKKVRLRKSVTSDLFSFMYPLSLLSKSDSHSKGAEVGEKHSFSLAVEPAAPALARREGGKGKGPAKKEIE